MSRTVITRILAPSFDGWVAFDVGSPAFGHCLRTMGFLLEKMKGRPASFQDLDMCETALGKLHGMGFVHGDVNRCNFLIRNEGVDLLDFEHLVENASSELMLKELENVRVELVDNSGRGGGFIFPGDSN